MQGGQPPPLGQGDLGSILPIWHVKLDERHQRACFHVCSSSLLGAMMHFAVTSDPLLECNRQTARTGLATAN